jgi:hypothetical protein
MEWSFKRKPALVVLVLMVLAIAAISAGCGSKTTGTQSGTEGGLIQQTKKAANEAARQANLRIIDSAVDLYYSSKGLYPTDINQLVPDFLPKIPTDPEGGTYYLKAGEVKPQAAVN